jgi:hypothetical protein
MLIRSFSIIPVELRKIRDPKTLRVRNSVRVLRIGFLVNSSTPFGVKVKFPQGSRDLVSNSLSHAPIIVNPYVRRRVGRCPGK